MFEHSEVLSLLLLFLSLDGSETNLGIIDALLHFGLFHGNLPLVFYHRRKAFCEINVALAHFRNVFTRF
jgi:hypothetical protein